MRTVIFDVGNVLIDWNVYALFRTMLPDDDAIAAFLDETGLLIENVELDRGKPFAVSVVELSERYPHHAALFRAYDERWTETVTGRFKGPSISSPSFGKKMFRFTRSPISPTRNGRLRKPLFPFLRDSFRDVIVSGEENLIKPNPEIYRIALSRNDLTAEDCVFIDDSPANIASAKQLGIDAVLFTSPGAFRDALIDRGIL